MQIFQKISLFFNKKSVVAGQSFTLPTNKGLYRKRAHPSDSLIHYNKSIDAADSILDIIHFQLLLDGTKKLILKLNQGICMLLTRSSEVFDRI